VSGLRGILRRDWDATVERFLEWSWERGAFLFGAIILMLSVVALVAQLARMS
jgi:hypothetical protein